MLNIGNVFILGDSYSTYEGCIPEGYATWYQDEESEATDVRKVEQTWWHQFLASTESNLLLNCSWSGTTICHTGYGGEDCSHKSFIARLDRLIEDGYFEKNQVDTLIVFGGTNDSWADSPIGKLQYSDWKREELFCVLPAFCYLLDRLKSKLSEMRVVCVINTDLKTEIADGFKTACARYGTEYIELKEIDKRNGHPNIRGMKQIMEQVLEGFRKIMLQVQ